MEWVCSAEKNKQPCELEHRRACLSLMSTALWWAVSYTLVGWSFYGSRTLWGSIRRIPAWCSLSAEHAFGVCLCRSGTAPAEAFHHHRMAFGKTLLLEACLWLSSIQIYKALFVQSKALQTLQSFRIAEWSSDGLEQISPVRRTVKHFGVDQ